MMLEGGRKSLPILRPARGKEHFSVIEGGRHWQVACLSSELRTVPLARTVLGIPIVLFRTEGSTPAAMLDRCPHRNVPLSMGKVIGGNLQCAYHGWEFGVAGNCLSIPGLAPDRIRSACHGKGYPAIEQDGLVHVWLHETPPGDQLPIKLPLLGEAGYSTLHRIVEMPGSLHATIENALDVPHTAFLHALLFRGQGEPRDMEVVVRRWGQGVEAEYIGEPCPTGLMGRLLAPGGGLVYHVDRFFLPGLAQVEYRLSERAHILVSSFCTPVSDFETRMHAVVSFRLPFPHWVVRLILEPIAGIVLRQDARVLAAQTRNVDVFGGEQFASTELDVLGGGIWRLLKEAALGEDDRTEARIEEKRFIMRV